MKRKIEDKARVRNDLVLGQRYGNDIFVEEMEFLKGKEITISWVNDDDYRIKEDNYNWTDEMLEELPVVKEPIKLETKVHIHTILPYTFNAIVTNPDGTIIQTQINPGSKPSYKAIYQGNKTIVILADGSKGVSKCSPEDKYNLQKGHDIAMVRAKMKSLVKELKKLRK